MGMHYTMQSLNSLSHLPLLIDSLLYKAVEEQNLVEVKSLLLGASPQQLERIYYVVSCGVWSVEKKIGREKKFSKP